MSLLWDRYQKVWYWTTFAKYAIAYGHSTWSRSPLLRTCAEGEKMFPGSPRMKIGLR